MNFRDLVDNILKKDTTVSLNETQKELVVSIFKRPKTIQEMIDKLQIKGLPKESIDSLSKKINEVTFNSPFIKYNLKKEGSLLDILHLLRLAIASEYEATQLYQQIAQTVRHPSTKKILLDIAKEELVHVGELQQLLYSLSPEDLKTSKEGRNEVKDKLDIEYKATLENTKDPVDMKIQSSKLDTAGRKAADETITSPAVEADRKVQRSDSSINEDYKTMSDTELVDFYKEAADINNDKLKNFLAIEIKARGLSIPEGSDRETIQDTEKTPTPPTPEEELSKEPPVSKEDTEVEVDKGANDKSARAQVDEDELKRNTRKESLGNDGGEKYFYLARVLDDEDNLQRIEILDAEDNVVMSTDGEEEGDGITDLDNTASIKTFLQNAFRKLEIANINYEVVEEYFFDREDGGEKPVVDKPEDQMLELGESINEELLFKYGFTSESTQKLLEKFGLLIDQANIDESIIDEAGLPPQQTAGEVPSQEMPQTDQGNIVADKPASAMIADYSTPEVAKSQIQLDYPEEPLTTTAVVFADSFINDPAVYKKIRKLKWDGIYTDVDGIKAQAKIVGDYRNFSSEIVKLLTDRLGNGAKYKLGRNNGPTISVVIRDPYYSISLSGLKELVAAEKIEKTEEPGEVILTW